MHPLEAALQERAGKALGSSDWTTIDQARIDAFADATGDHQWIHVDPERARRKLPSGSTIAHGFLTLSLLPALMEQVIELPALAASLNYGANKIRFLAPVPAGSRVRARITLSNWEQTQRGYLVTWGVEVELEGSDKPACVAELLSLLQPA